jgi:hypothetical protein
VPTIPFISTAPLSITVVVVFGDSAAAAAVAADGGAVRGTEGISRVCKNKREYKNGGVRMSGKKKSKEECLEISR